MNMRRIFLLDGRLQQGGLSESKDNHDSVIFRYTFPYNEEDINSISNELRYYKLYPYFMDNFGDHVILLAIVISILFSFKIACFFLKRWVNLYDLQEKYVYNIVVAGFAGFSVQGLFYTWVEIYCFPVHSPVGIINYLLSLLYLLIYLLVYFLIIWRVVVLRLKLYNQENQEKEQVKNYMLPITLDKQQDSDQVENIFTKKFEDTTEPKDPNKIFQLPTYLKENYFEKYAFICTEYKTHLTTCGRLYPLIDTTKYLLFTLIIVFFQAIPIP